MGRILFLLSILLLFAVSIIGQEYQARYVTFISRKAKLSGKLIVPGNKGAYPVVVFLVGFGGKASYRTTYARFALENLEIPLLQEGVALFYYDKRGVKPSEGSWASTNLYQRAEDAMAAIRFLKNQPDIDSTRIGVVGHCEGGWVTQIVAARYSNQISFGVCLAASVVTAREQLKYTYLSEALCRGIDPYRALRRAERKTQRTYSALSLLPVGEYRHWGQVCDYTPHEELCEIRSPFLLLFAENDPFICLHENRISLFELFSEGLPDNFSVRCIDGANHDFLLAPKCYRGKGSELLYAQQFKDIFTEWVLKQIY